MCCCIIHAVMLRCHAMLSCHAVMDVVVQADVAATAVIHTVFHAAVVIDGCRCLSFW